MTIAERVNKIALSPTLKISAKAKAMKAEGIDVIDLSAGEPDFPTPDNIKEKAIRAINENFTKYTQADGMPELKSAIISKIKEDHNLEYSQEEVIVSSGAKNSLYHLILSIISSGDEVIIPSPYWVTYPEIVNLSDGKSVYIKTKEENEFKITIDELKSAISPRTKALILNNPSNPTGTVYTRKDLENLADIIIEEGIIVIADEVYEKLIYDGLEFTSFASIRDDLKDKTVLINGVSKSYSMTGWRIGYALGPSKIIKAMARIQSHSTSNPCSVSQKAAIEALKGPQHEQKRMISEFQRRRNFVLSKLKTIQDISCFKPNGSFYLFPNLSSFYTKEYKGSLIRNSYGLAYHLLKHGKVAIVPGDAFGNDDCIRISYATSMEKLEKAMDRIIETLSLLKVPKRVKKIKLLNTITDKKELFKPEQINTNDREIFVSLCEENLSYDNYYEWNVNINGIIVQLRTNIQHISDFWVENWYPAQLETDLEPHAIIYAVSGITGREPRSYYNPETRTGIMINIDNYRSCRHLALNLAVDVLEKIYNTHSVRALSLEVNGRGVLFIGQHGTRKMELIGGLLSNNETRLHSLDLNFIRYADNLAFSDSSERKFFLPTSNVESYPNLAPLMDRSKCENVITEKGECQDSECLQSDTCRLDRGSPYCYRATKNSFSIFDPYWIGGVKKHAKRINVDYIFLLRCDRISSLLEEINKDEALRILETAIVPGSSFNVTGSNREAFFNPYLISRGEDRLNIQKKFYQKLFLTSACYIVNTGRGDISLVIEEIRKVILR